MSAALRRIWAWLCAPENPGVPFERVIELREEAYRIGVEVGTLRGRVQLARELQLEFPPHHPMSAEDAENVKARQVH